MEEIESDLNDLGNNGRRAGSGEPGVRGPRPRGAVTGGWGFDSADTDAPQAQPVSRTTAEPPSPMSDRNNNKKGHFDGDDDAVPTIPDLEEETEEDITRQVAAPPASGVAYQQPVRSVRELDAAIISGGPGGRSTQLPASPEEGVDLAPLMQCLCSERQVFEADTNWDHELIFQEVASAINADLAASEEGGEESNAIDHMGNAAQ